MRAQRQEELEPPRPTAEEFAARHRAARRARRNWPRSRPGLADYRVALAGLWPAAEASQDGAPGRGRGRRRNWPRAEERLDEAAEAAARRPGRTASAAQAMYEALLETAGAAVEELNRQAGRASAGTLERRGADEKARASLEQQALGDRGKAEGDAGHAARARSTRRRGCATPPSRSSSRSPRPGCCASRCRDLDVPDVRPSRGRRRRPCCWPGP